RVLFRSSVVSIRLFSENGYRPSSESSLTCSAMISREKTSAGIGSPPTSTVSREKKVALLRYGTRASCPPHWKRRDWLRYVTSAPNVSLKSSAPDVLAPRAVATIWWRFSGSLRYALIPPPGDVPRPLNDVTPIVAGDKAVRPIRGA